MLRIGWLEMILLVPLILIGIVIYFLPTIIAAVRRHPNVLLIFLVNLLLGWTVIGWAGTLVWAFILPGTIVLPGKSPVEIARERYARGEITAADFEEIKRNLT